MGAPSVRPRRAPGGGGTTGATCRPGGFPLPDRAASREKGPGGGARGVSASGHQAPWHFLNFLPLPQWQGSLRPGVSARRTASTRGPMLFQRRRRS